METGISDHAGGHRQWGPVAHGRVLRDGAAWTAGDGTLRRISSAPDRPPLPAPHLKMLYRHPSMGRDGGFIVLLSPRVKGLFRIKSMPIRLMVRSPAQPGV